MDTPIPEFLAEAANRRVSDIFIIAGRPLAEKIDGHLLDRGDRLMPDQTENLLRTIYGLAENRDISRLMETGDDDFSFSMDTTKSLIDYNKTITVTTLHLADDIVIWISDYIYSKALR